MKGLIFTYLLAYGGAIVSLFRPFYGLLIYICFAIIKPEALWYWAVPPGNYSRIIFVGLFLGWAAKGFGTWRFGRARLIAAALLIYQVWLVLGAFGAADQPLAWQTVEETAKTVLPVLVGLSLIESTRQLLQIAWVMVFSLGYLALEFNLSYYEGFNRLSRVGFAGMDDKSVAILMVVGASAGLFLALGVSRWWLKGVTASASLLMLHVPLFTYSRGGMLGLLGAAVIALWLIPKRPAAFGAFAFVVVVGLGLAGPSVRQQFATSFADVESRDWSAQSRLELWSQAWETMVEHPFFGVGPRQWGGWAQVQYGWSGPKEVHNTWFQAGAELGFPGVTALAVFFLAPAFGLLRTARLKVGDVTPDEATLARLVITASAGFLVTSQFITVYGLEVPYYIALIGAGVLKLRSSAPQAVTVGSVRSVPAGGVWLQQPQSPARSTSVKPHRS